MGSVLSKVVVKRESKKGKLIIALAKQLLNQPEAHRRRSIGSILKHVVQCNTETDAEELDRLFEIFGSSSADPHASTTAMNWESLQLPWHTKHAPQPQDLARPLDEVQLYISPTPPPGSETTATLILCVGIISFFIVVAHRLLRNVNPHIVLEMVLSNALLAFCVGVVVQFFCSAVFVFSVLVVLKWYE